MRICQTTRVFVFSLTMKFSATVFHAVLLIISNSHADGQNVQSCVSPQYCELNKSCVIQCAFEAEYYAMYWYNSTDTKKANPFIAFDVERGKSGTGFSLGEFDLLPNGSLLIRSVSREHEHTFRVMMLSDKFSGSPYIEDVDVYLKVVPQQKRPFVTECDHKSTCYKDVVPSSHVSCSVRDSRPAANLIWCLRTAHFDKELSSQRNITLKSSLYTTNITVQVDMLFQSGVSLALLVCKVTNSPISLSIDETPVVIFNSERDIFATTSVKRTKSLHQQQVQVTCPDGNYTMYVWRKKLSDGIDETISYVAADSTINLSLPTLNFIVKDGALTIFEIDFHYEGYYGCLGSNGETEDSIVYEIIVYVPPSPPYPVVLGCNNPFYCLLEIETSGYLTCSLQRVRPLINLEWRALPGKKEHITFSDEAQTITSHGETFDVTLTVWYQLTKTSHDTVPLECISAGEHKELNTLVARVDLMPLSVNRTTDHPTTSRGTEQDRKWFIYLGVFVTIIIAVVALTMVRIKGKQRRRRRRKKEENKDETKRILPLDNRSRDSKPELLKDLKAQLQDKYSEIYGRVQPIPFLHEKLYSVDEVFVNNGLQYLQSGNWRDLSSYEDIFTNPCNSSTRIFIEGNPGYGKSTLAKKIAYDWCNSGEEGVMSKFDILILLCLRQLGQTKSIYKAVKLLLLTRDSKLTEEDIESILQNDHLSTCFIFDGFDEYKHEHMDDSDQIESDVNCILRGDMFRSSLVILTTRTSNLPGIFLPQTLRVRLIEFDDNIRSIYIEKAIVGGNEEASHNIKQHLKANPVLNDICGIPMVFVMFAHLAHKGDEIEKLVTVTKVFRFVLSCFYSHLESKLSGKKFGNFSSYQIENTKLDQLAYNGLHEKAEGTYWDKKRVCEIIGNELYEKFSDIGILMEEETLQINDDDTVAQSDILVKKKIRFYHKLFWEWYAGNYLAALAMNISREKLWRELHQLEYSKYEYVYRFACGQEVEAATRIIKFLYATQKHLQFSLFCVVENIDVMEEFKDIAVTLCSENVLFNANDEIFTQRSLARVLQVASEKQITISHIWVRGIFRSVDTARNCIVFKNNVTLPSLRTLHTLHIYEEGKEFQDGEINDILAYVNSCNAIKELCFHLCFLPYTIGHYKTTLRTSVELYWYPISTSQYIFISTTGKWQDTDGRFLTHLDYQKEAQTWRSWSLKQLDEPKQTEHI